MPKKIKVKKLKNLKNLDVVLQYYQSGNFQEAETLCRKILGQNPGKGRGGNLDKSKGLYVHW